MHYKRKYEACNSKTETLRDEDAFLELKVKTTNFDLFQIYKLFSAICKTFIMPKYSVYIIVSECVLFITLFDDLNLCFNLKHHTCLGVSPPTFLGAHPPVGLTTLNAAQCYNYEFIF